MKKMDIRQDPLLMEIFFQLFNSEQAMKTYIYFKSGIISFVKNAKHTLFQIVLWFYYIFCINNIFKFVS